MNNTLVILIIIINILWFILYIIFIRKHNGLCNVVTNTLKLLIMVNEENIILDNKIHKIIRKLKE